MMETLTLLDKAVMFAAKKHEGVMRKGGIQPYIFHPLEVVSLASMITDDQEVLCACMLHDVLEDTPTVKYEIQDKFNERIMNLVVTESENKRSGESREASWKARKEEAIEQIKNSNDIGSKIVCLCDKVSNLRSFHLLQLQKGDDMWNIFHNNNPKDHYWYYTSLYEALSDLKDEALYKEMGFLIDTIFQKYI